MDSTAFEQILLAKFQDINTPENDKSKIYDYFQKKEKDKEKELTARETSLVYQLGKFLNSKNKNVIL